MDSDPLDRLEQLFQAALQHPPEERTAFLDAACAKDPALRAELKSLLAADVASTEEAFLAAPAAPWQAALQATDPDAFPDGEFIGPYRVLRRIGQGGMGDVYLGMREEPFRRYVALKIIPRGMDSRDVVARFAVERQILASLDHRGIAHLIDGGVTDDGRPYFAMEYVDGRPITMYCDEHRLSLRERLRLFVAVCEAVHYAHQNLVLHRDLKPSNILVTAHGEVKLLDFGIAKLLNPQLSHLPIPVTREARPLLTPEYASPEQARGEPLTTASDVYSLGVLLYELLTGLRPHALAGRPIQDIIRILTEHEPLTPSAALGRATAPKPADRAVPAKNNSAVPAENDGATLAKARHLSPDRLRRRLQGDLDAITMKALRKEPNRRYGSAGLLIQDIERHLEGQAVMARRGNRWYRFNRFMRRNRVETIAAGLIVLALLGGMGAALWQAAEARRARDRAERAQVQAEEVAGFLEGLFAASDPYALSAERLDTLEVRALLARGAERARTELVDQPLVLARMFDTVGRVYRSLGLYEEARPLLEQALDVRRRAGGPRHPDVAESLTHLAVLALDTGDYARAREHLEAALALRTRLYGADHPTIAVDLNYLGAVLREQGRYDEAEARHLEALDMLRRTAGERDRRLTLFLTELVATLEQKGNYDGAERYARESIALHRALYGTDHPQTAIALREMGLILQRGGDYRDAEQLFRESLGIAERALGAEHPQVADLLNRLASVRYWQKDLAAADSIHRRSIALKRKLYGDVHIEVAYGLNNLASVLRERGAFDEADALHLEAMDITRATVGEDHSNYWILMGSHGMTLRAAGDCGRAEPMLRAAIDGVHRTLPRDPIRAPWIQRWLGECLVDLGRYPEAETLLLESYTALQGPRSPADFVQGVTESLVTLYTAWGKPEEAAAYQARITAGRPPRAAR